MSHAKQLSAPERRRRARPTTVLIAEERAMTADTMARAICHEAEMSVTSCCRTRDEVATACALSPPDVAVVDAGLYEYDVGFAVASLREHASMVRVLPVIPHLDAEQLARALIAGALNCISAHADTDAFMAALRATASGRSIRVPALHDTAMRLILEIGDRGSQRLSSRERQVLRLAATGLSVESIAAQLFISVHTAKTYLYRSYRKLGAKNRIGAIALATRRGLLR